MKEEKQERRRELKAAVKERKRLLIRQCAEEKIAKIAEAQMKKEQLKKRRKESKDSASTCKRPEGSQNKRSRVQLDCLPEKKQKGARHA